MDFNQSLFLLESNFVKDALDKVITGDFKLSDKEKEKLLSLGLIGKNGKPTQKAKEEYSELFESYTNNTMSVDKIKKLISNNIKVSHNGNKLSQEDVRVGIIVDVFDDGIIPSKVRIVEAITVKDLLNKHEDGYKLSATELDALIRADLITKDGKITKKAKAIYPELFESNQLQESTRVRNFKSTGSAYDSVQTSDVIKKGDILVIKSEKVVGIADTWPFAVTVKHGDLHGLKEGYITSLQKEFPSIPEAIELAKSYGWATIEK